MPDRNPLPFNPAPQQRIMSDRGMMMLLDMLAEQDAAARERPRIPFDEFGRWATQHGAWQDQQALQHMQSNLWMLLGLSPFGMKGAVTSAGGQGYGSALWRSLRPSARAVEHGVQRVRWRNHPTIGPKRDRIFPERIRDLDPSHLPKAPLAFAGGMREMLSRPPFAGPRPGPGGGTAGGR